MIFSPIELIFIEWIGDMFYFCGIFDFSKSVFLGGMTSKIEFEQIGVMDMSYIMDSGQNGLYTTFPTSFFSISADPADLSKNQKKKSFSQKNHDFLIDNVL